MTEQQTDAMRVAHTRRRFTNDAVAQYRKVRKLLRKVEKAEHDLELMMQDDRLDIVEYGRMTTEIDHNINLAESTYPGFGTVAEAAWASACNNSGLDTTGG